MNHIVLQRILELTESGNPVLISLGNFCCFFCDCYYCENSHTLFLFSFSFPLIHSKAQTSWFLEPSKTNFEFFSNFVIQTMMAESPLVNLPLL